MMLMPATAYAAHVGAVLLNLTVSLAGASVFGRYTDKLVGPGPDDIARASRGLACIAWVAVLLTAAEIALNMLSSAGG